MEHKPTAKIEEPKIPGDMVELFEKVIGLCKEYGCSGVDLSVSPRWESGFWGQLKCQWTQGRHGVPENAVVICELRSHIKV